ncbi:MAG TPA: PIN domain-containing protein [Tepidisphaeraceae bacterium]|jgi:predicted nucleic acid-binding protein|nr:PIN domain-containing protein [Tepidisphaeraceae bacterium]
MISIDTNILLPGVEADNPHHEKAAAFIESLQMSDEVAISEFILLELYNLLRNPAVLKSPLSAASACNVCESFRHHPRWQVIGFPPDSRAFHDLFWPRLRDKSFARRRAYDWRSALSMLRNGVTELATVNIKDFQGFGFSKVWNPLA